MDATLPSTGFRLASLITAAIRQAPFVPETVPYADIERYIYQCVQSIADEQFVGDWLEMPNGTTYTLTFKPTRQGA